MQESPERGVELLGRRVCVSSTLSVNQLYNMILQTGWTKSPSHQLPPFREHRSSLCLISQHYFHLQALNHRSVLPVPRPQYFEEPDNMDGSHQPSCFVSSLNVILKS